MRRGRLRGLWASILQARMAGCERPNGTRPNARATPGWIRALRFGVCLALVLGSLGTVAPANATAQPLHITLDAGHGGSEIGASYRFADGVVLQEKTLTLRVALRVRQLLEQAGFLVTLTRSSDAPLNTAGLDLNGDGRVGLADELQARVDVANRAGSDLFVSICFNGSSDPAISGTETFWNPNRSFSDRSKRLADLAQTSMVADLAAAGYRTHDRGARTDASLLGGDALFLLGPKSSIIARPSQMPAILGESLFLTNPADATALRDDRIVEAVARGYFDGVQAYTRSAASGAAAGSIRHADRASAARRRSDPEILDGVCDNVPGYAGRAATGRTGHPQPEREWPTGDAAHGSRRGLDPSVRLRCRRLG